jgi:hypothetical protein
MTAAATPRSAPNTPWAPRAIRTPALVLVLVPDGDAPEPVALALVLPVAVDEAPVADAPPTALLELLPLLPPPVEVEAMVGILVMAVQVPPVKTRRVSFHFLP